MIEDLEKAQELRSEFPWIIVFTHLDMYCSTDFTDPNYEDDYHECLEDAVKFWDYAEDLFYNNTVDLVF